MYQRPRFVLPGDLPIPGKDPRMKKQPRSPARIGAISAPTDFKIVTPHTELPKCRELRPEPPTRAPPSPPRVNHPGNGETPFSFQLLSVPTAAFPDFGEEMVAALAEIGLENGVDPPSCWEETTRQNLGGQGTMGEVEGAWDGGFDAEKDIGLCRISSQHPPLTGRTLYDVAVDARDAYGTVPEEYKGEASELDEPIRMRRISQAKAMRVNRAEMDEKMLKRMAIRSLSELLINDDQILSRQQRVGQQNIIILASEDAFSMEIYKSAELENKETRDTTDDSASGEYPEEEGQNTPDISERNINTLSIQTSIPWEPTRNNVNELANFVDNIVCTRPLGLRGGSGGEENKKYRSHSKFEFVDSDDDSAFDSRSDNSEDESRHKQESESTSEILASLQSRRGSEALKRVHPLDNLRNKIHGMYSIQKARSEDKTYYEGSDIVVSNMEPVTLTIWPNGGSFSMDLTLGPRFAIHHENEFK